MNKKNRKMVGLSLGSGGIRGIAHIGVIKVLLENKIPIDFISGASAGALVGSYFALFGEVNSLEKLILKNPRDLLPMFFDFSLRGGFISGEKMDIFLKKTLKNTDFSKTKIPLFTVSTDLISGQPVFSSSGKIATAVRGSISIPIVFKPLSHEGKLLVDGGISDPVPVGILKQNGANVVIAVNLYHHNEFDNKKFTVSNIAMRSTRIALHNLSKLAVRNANLVLNPDLSFYVNELSMTDYIQKDRIKEMIAIGEQEAIKALPQIKKLLNIK